MAKTNFYNISKKMHCQLLSIEDKIVHIVYATYLISTLGTKEIEGVNKFYCIYRVLII